jgi:hypothetical protein
MTDSVATLGAMKAALGGLDRGVDDGTRIDRIRLLEELKGAVAAAQARDAADFAASQRAEQVAQGVRAERAGRGIAKQVGMARRTSPWHAARYVGWATILTSELPATFAELAAGRITEWRAMIVARETIWLSREGRATVDARLAARLHGWNDRQVEAAVKALAYQLDREGYVARLGKAAADRRVTVRPAPDVMAMLTATLPVAQAVAAYAALKTHADTLIATGDPRTRGQIMADTLVARLTGQEPAEDVAVEINLIMTDQTLFDGDEAPATVVGHGPIPAWLARRLVFGPRDTVPRWIRRLYTHPGTGQLSAMDSRRRIFTTNQRHFITLRDQTCRTPYCGAPIRHIDHVQPYGQGGPTSIDNAQGLCAACNLAKQAPGWSTTTDGQTIITRTPTGHWYPSRPPDVAA